MVINPRLLVTIDPDTGAVKKGPICAGLGHVIVYGHSWVKYQSVESQKWSFISIICCWSPMVVMCEKPWTPLTVIIPCSVFYFTGKERSLVSYEEALCSMVGSILSA